MHEISPQQCREWAARLQGEIASQYFGNVVGTLRLIIHEGLREQIKKGGKALQNPATEVSRAKIPQKVMRIIV